MGSREGRKKFMLGPVSHVKLPSEYGRCALSVDINIVDINIILPFTICTTYRLVNVHLDSLEDTLPYRTEQMEILANLRRSCGGGLIAGDFNAISPEDRTLIDKNGVALHGRNGLDGATWGVEVYRHVELEPGRLEKVAMLGVDSEAKDTEILHLGLTRCPSPARRPTVFLAAATTG